jgi:TolB protein
VRKINCRLVFPLFVIILPAVGGLAAQSASAPIGIFQNHADIGTVLHTGSAQYDAARGTYTLTGSGDNMWFTADAFRFAWKQVFGDIALTAGIAFPDKGGNPHRKAVLMIRQSLDADSPYANVALHGEGLTSLQVRDTKGGATHEIQSNLSAPGRLRLEKRGDFIYLFLSSATGEPLRPSGASIKIPLQGPFYVGIGVCSHDKNAIEKAVFSNVEITTPAASTAPPVLFSALETVTVSSTDRRVVYVSPTHFEAPNWSRDGTYYLFNSDGHILQLPVAGGTPATIDTGSANRCNNDHGISPDGKTLAYCAQRNGEFDIYTIPAAGGEETRLTRAKGLDDGPDYSPDGQYIYFNSERTGQMQVWRMHADGSAQEQVTFDDLNNWFPHISPDGKSMAVLSYEKNVTGHPPNKDVQLRLMNLADGQIKVLARLFGGQGTINVPSWSPDGLKVAFVSYELIPAEEAATK